MSKSRSKPDKITDKIRLNKHIANSGYCSRRKADQLIEEGKVSVNGEIIKNLGYKIDREDEIEIEGKKLKKDNQIYIVINKPKDHISTTSDEKGRKTVLELIKTEEPVRIYPVGRLDRNTTGVLLFTNDGTLTTKLLHPRRKITKTYLVTLDKSIERKTMDQIEDGVTVDNKLIPVDSVDYYEKRSKNKVIITIHSGQYHVVKRIFEEVENRVKQLDRLEFAGINTKGLRRGEWRYLTPREIKLLKTL